MKNFYVLLEQLNDYQIKLVDYSLGGNKYNPYKHHGDIFENGLHRKEIPLHEGAEKNDIEKRVRNTINKMGYDIEDYKDGLASQEYIDKMGNKRKRIIKIGKLLNNDENIGLAKEFSYDPFRDVHSNGLKIILSRDKYDIAGMSTGRDWNSCMTLPDSKGGDEGAYNEHIKDDLKHGTMVAYLVKKGDDDIENPIARVNVKKYISKGHVIWRPENKAYGKPVDGFVSSVESYMSEKYPAKEKKEYVIHPDLYDDTRDTIEPIRRGLVKNQDGIKGTYIHYNQNGKIEDYIDDKGNHMPSQYDGKYYYHRKNDEFHREHGLPAIYDAAHTNAEYYINGVHHRDGDNPAVIGNNTKKYYKHGLLHRPYGKPAVIEFRDNDNKKNQYYEYGLLHREGDKPADEEYYDSGIKLIRKGYYNRGLLHREGDKPALTIHHGETRFIKYAKNGETHREGDKPSQIRIDKNRDGSSYKKLSYYKHGLLSREGYKPTEIEVYKNSSGEITHYAKNYGGSVIPKGKPFKIEYQLEDDNAINELLKHKVTVKHFIDEDNNIVVHHYGNGKLISKTWYDKGAKKRSFNLPFRIQKFTDKVVKEYQPNITAVDYLNGRNLTQKDKQIKYDDKTYINRDALVGNGHKYSRITTSNIHDFKDVDINQSRGFARVIKFNHEGNDYILSQVHGKWQAFKLNKGVFVGTAKFSLDIPKHYEDKHSIDSLVNNVTHLSFDDNHNGKKALVDLKNFDGNDIRDRNHLKGIQKLIGDVK